MEAISIISILAIDLAVVFVSGYMLAWAMFSRSTDLGNPSERSSDGMGRLESSKMIVFSGIFGMAQIVFAYFLVKTLFALDVSIAVTFIIDIVAVIFRWISNMRPQDIKDGPKQDVSAHT